MKASVYLETTVISYFGSRPSPDIVINARQQITQQWWELRIGDFDLFVSDLVYKEISKGDADAAAKRIDAIKTFKVLEIDDEAMRIAETLVRQSAIPIEFIEDAIHIGAAAVNGLDYILTWNFAHINNAENRARIDQNVKALGYVCPIICTPEELIRG
jgi:hypothetical protein